MSLINLNIGKVKIPIYDIGTIAAGFYIGYNESKGIDMSPATEYLTKYGPTIFAMSATPIFIKLKSQIHKKIIQEFNNENYEVTLKNGSKKNYKFLDEDEKKEITPKIIEQINNLESQLKNPNYLKPTILTGSRTAIETMIGYGAGVLYSYII